MIIIPREGVTRGFEFYVLFRGKISLSFWVLAQILCDFYGFGFSVKNYNVEIYNIRFTFLAKYLCGSWFSGPL